MSKMFVQIISAFNSIFKNDNEFPENYLEVYLIVIENFMFIDNKLIIVFVEQASKLIIIIIIICAPSGVYQEVTSHVNKFQKFFVLLKISCLLYMSQ